MPRDIKLLGQRGLKNLERNLNKIVNDVYSNKNRNMLGREARNIVYKRVKAGRGVNSDSSDPDRTKLVALKKLSESYKRYRRGQIRFITKRGRVIPIKAKRGKKFPSPVTGRFGTPNKSNLTLTGQMLDSMRHKLRATYISVFIPKKRRVDGGKTNFDVSEFARKTRPFLAIARREQRILQNELRRMTSKAIKKNSK